MDRMGKEELATVSREFKSYQSEWEQDPTNPPGLTKLQNLNVNLLLTEIYINAEKRAEQGMYDDAVLRHYRLLEMTAQIQLLIHYGIYNGYTRADQIPEVMRQVFVQRFRFIHLKSGLEFLKYGIQTSRNLSILAHGLAHIGE